MVQWSAVAPLPASERFKFPPIRGMSAGSPLSAAVAAAALGYVDAHPELRTELRARADYLRSGLRRYGADVLESPAPIVAFTFGGGDSMVELEKKAFQAGIVLYLSNYLRYCWRERGYQGAPFFRDHTYEDIDQLLDFIRGL